MADFADVSVTLDNTTLNLHGQATSDVDTPFTATATVKDNVDGTTTTYTVAGSRSVKTAQETVLESVTDDQGGNWQIAADGQSATEV